MQLPALCVALSGICLFSVGIASAQPIVSPAASMPRVRTVDTVLATLIREASARSVTFRELVETIEASNGIVYVDHGNCGHGVRACLVTVTAAGPARILQVRVGRRKTDWDLMGSIGHELRHAVEVLSDPTVTSTVAMHFFYEREGRRTANRFETDAAIRAGDRVRHEVRRQATVVVEAR